MGFSRALKMPHRGIFARRDAKRRAQAVRILPCNPCIVCRKNKKQRPTRCCFWRRRWDSNPRGIAAKLISSFLVYIATDGICRKKAEVVGRWFDRPTTKNVEKEALFNVRTSQFEPISKCRFFGKNERKTGIFGTLERCWREKQERTKKLNFPYCYGHLQKCVD